jgi:hypothetical protein
MNSMAEFSMAMLTITFAAVMLVIAKGCGGTRAEPT